MAVQRGGAVERLARVETKLEGVEAAINDGKSGFEKIRQTMDTHAAETRKAMDELKHMVAETHAACVKPADLVDIANRIKPLETFRDRVKRYSSIASALAAVIIGALTLFGPTRVAEAWRQLWG